jgi:hypothetical protein
MYERKRPKIIVSLRPNITGEGDAENKETNILPTTLKAPSSENTNINKNKLSMFNIIIFF